jgi:hypothetical protein
MMTAVGDALERLYPQRRWDERDEEAAFRGGVPRAEGIQLAQMLATKLKAMALFRPGSDEEYCDYVYVLCLGRTPSIVEIREGLASAAALDADETPAIDELYLRVALSSLVRFAGVQQVAMRMSQQRDELLITESPRAGVFDPVLLRRFQSLVAVLAELDIRHVDFGEIVEPPAGYDPGDYAQRFAGEPTVANYLFYPQPCSAVTTTVVVSPAGGRSAPPI